MKLPKEVKVGQYTFRVVEWARSSAEANRRYGEFSPLEGVIRVREGMDPITMATTLHHEIGHAISFVFVMKDSDNEERTVETMANGWITIFRDNPELIAWFSRACKC